MLIQVRHDTAANWAQRNPVLALGEPGVETDTLIYKQGDGVTPWVSLPKVTGAPAMTPWTNLSGLGANVTLGTPPAQSRMWPDAGLVYLSGRLVLGGVVAIGATLATVSAPTAARQITGEFLGVLASATVWNVDVLGNLSCAVALGLGNSISLDSMSYRLI